MKIEFEIFCMESICTIMLHHYGQYVLVDILILWNLHTQVNIISNRIWLLLLHWYGGELQLSHLRPTDHCKVVLQTFFSPLLHEGNLTTSALKHSWFAVLQAWSWGYLPANFIRLFENISKVICRGFFFPKVIKIWFLLFLGIVLCHNTAAFHFFYFSHFCRLCDCAKYVCSSPPSHLAQKQKHPSWWLCNEALKALNGNVDLCSYVFFSPVMTISCLGVSWFSLSALLPPSTGK